MNTEAENKTNAAGGKSRSKGCLNHVTHPCEGCGRIAGRAPDVIDVGPSCRKCGSKLNLDEMHYYDNGDGTATCNDCEGKWTDEMAAWRRGELDRMPSR